MGMDVCGKGDTNAYFRASCWSWRPIHALCETVIDKDNLNFNTQYWGSNDGRGLETQQDCDRLADALEAHLKSIELNEENDRIFLCLGSWSTVDGRFINQDVEDELNETYPIGTVLSSAVVMKDGTIAYSAHSTSFDHIKEFISFLRKCGGFEIW